MAQSDDNTFTEPKFGLSMKYPSDWRFISLPGEPNPYGHLYFVGFCPRSYLENEPSIISCHESPVELSINVYKLADGTTLKDFYDEQIADLEDVKALSGASKNIEITNVKISGLSAIQTLSTHSGSGGSLGRLLKEIGQEPPTSKDVNLYLVNGSTGYQISGGTNDQSDFDFYLPVIQKMIDSFQIQGANENLDNAAFIPDTKTAPTDDLVLLSHRMKKGSGDYNDIIGQVKNIGSDTVEFVKIGLTVYDKNSDVVGTDSTYADSTTLKPNQKSSFDIFSSKNNFNAMKNYELTLQWRDSNGDDQYVDNAQIYKINATKQ